jgi:hypothetical protein
MYFNLNKITELTSTLVSTDDTIMVVWCDYRVSSHMGTSKLRDG